MLHTVQEVWVTKVDVLRTHVHKVVDICEHNFPLNYSKPSLIDSGDWAVAALVSTTAARFNISHVPELSLGGPQAGVLLQGR